MSSKTAFAIAGLVLATSAASATQAPGLILRHVTIVDGLGPARVDQTVVIQGERIVSVGPGFDEPPSFLEIDGTDRYLIPGLWDAHAHLSYWGADALTMLVDAGVTSIRELGGDLAEIGAWRREITAGERIGPSMVWSGPFLEGPDGGDEYRVHVATADEGRRAVRELLDAGVDFIKIQPRIDADVVRALVQEAGARGSYVVGHLPDGVDAVTGARMGLRSIEHMSPYMDLSDDQLDGVIDAFRSHGTWLSPALHSMVAGLQQRGDEAAPRIERARAIVRRFHRAGIPILVGSNFAYREWPWPPGTGLHDEMRALADAGLEASEILRLATVGAARFAGREHDVGAVRPGQRADLVLLRGDPTADVRNAAQINRVIVRGRVIAPTAQR